MSYGFVGEDEAGKEAEAGDAHRIVDGGRSSQLKPQPEDMRHIKLELL